MMNRFTRKHTNTECFGRPTKRNKLQMKLIIAITCVLFSMNVNAQNSEDLIPMDAVTVFSINNISLLQKISMDDLVQYEFMAEVQTELFDG